MFVVIYAPYSWLLMDYPWSDYRWSWIKMWPGLPVILPVSMAGRNIGLEVDDGLGLIMLDLLGLGLWIGLAWIGSRGRKRLIAIAVVVLLLSLLNSWGLYHLYLM